MSEQEKKDTENKIFEAAIKVFTEKGFAAARMQEIADRANINKALLHYYFRSKNRLFEAVFEFLIKQLAPLFITTLKNEDSLLEIFKGFFDKHISFMAKHPFIPGFVIHELNSDPEKLVRLFDFKSFPIDGFTEKLEKEKAARNIRNVDSKQILVNLISMSVFPFIARPMLMHALQLNDETFMEFLEERKKELPLMMWNSIKAE